MEAKDGITYANIINNEVSYIFTKKELSVWNDNDLKVVEIPKDLIAKVKVGTKYENNNFVIPEVIESKDGVTYAMLDSKNALLYTFTKESKSEYDKKDNVVEIDSKIINEIKSGDIYDKNKKTFNIDIEYVRSKYLDSINQGYEAAIQMILGEDTPLSEMISWETQEKEAKAFLESKDSKVAPSISVMANTRGVPLDIFANKIIEKANKYRAASSFLIGYRQKLISSLESSKDLESIRKCVFDYEFVTKSLQASTDSKTESKIESSQDSKTESKNTESKVDSKTESSQEPNKETKKG